MSSLIRVMLTTTLLVACAVATNPVATPIRSAATPVASTSRADFDCAFRTFDDLIDSFNRADQTRLAALLGSAAFGLSGQSYSVPSDAVAALVARNRAGERWTLLSFDVNGRGWHGGIDFGWRLRRSAPDLPGESVDYAGKGVLDCPEERFRILFIG